MPCTQLIVSKEPQSVLKKPVYTAFQTANDTSVADYLSIFLQLQPIPSLAQYQEHMAKSWSLPQEPQHLVSYVTHYLSLIWLRDRTHCVIKLTSVCNSPRDLAIIFPQVYKVKNQTVKILGSAGSQTLTEIYKQPSKKIKTILSQLAGHIKTIKRFRSEINI